MKKESKWWYPDDFWIEAIKILTIGFVVQILLIALIGIPNLIFGWEWLKYISWLLPLNFLICQIAITIIIIKGLWKKIKGELGFCKHKWKFIKSYNTTYFEVDICECIKCGKRKSFTL